MFYTNKEFFDALPNAFPMTVKTACMKNGQYNRKKAALVLKEIKKAVVNREGQVNLGQFFAPSVAAPYYGYSVGIAKFTRPWDVIPRLRNMRAPEGDFTVGVEVEYGFRSQSAAMSTAMHIRNWRNVALDLEGGTYGIEATFPPILYSKLRSSSQVLRYVKFLQARPQTLAPHESRAVGTHINVGMAHDLPGTVVAAMTSRLAALSSDQKMKYFGRQPYGYLYNHGRFVEYKLFNSVPDPKAVRRYIDIAVSLSKLMNERRNVSVAVDRDGNYNYFSSEEVVAALERGYNGKVL